MSGDSQYGENGIVFAVPKGDGSYAGMNGRIHYVNGRVTRLSMINGGDWGEPGTSLPATRFYVVVDTDVSGAGSPIELKRCRGHVMMYRCNDGVLDGPFDIGMAPLDLTDACSVSPADFPRLPFPKG